MRPWGIVLGLALVSAGWSQVEEGSSSVRVTAGEFFQRAGVFESGVGLPGQEEGGGKLPEKNQELPDVLTFVNADDLVFQGDAFTAKGNVEIHYKGYKLTGHQIEGNRVTRVFVLSGGGRLEGKDAREVVTGDRVEANFNDDTYTFQNGRGVILPARTSGLTTGPFYSTAGGGDFSEQHYRIVNGKLTSCDKDHPDYAFQLRDGEVVPGKKMVLRHVEVKVLGRRLFKLPYLYIPLLDDRPKYLPEFGQSPDEGYYVKNRYITPLHGNDFLENRLDLMSKKGIGLGEKWNYEGTKISGGLSVYGLSGTDKTLLATWQHKQRFGASDFTADTQYSRNNYLTSPGSTSISSRAQFTVPSGSGSREGSTGFSYYRTGSDTSSFSSVSQSWGLSDNRSFGRMTRTALNLTWSDSDSKSLGTTVSSSRRVDLRFQGDQDLRSLTASLLYQRSIPAGGTSSFSGSNDQTPMLTLATDAGRMFGPKAGRVWPFQLTGSVGELRDFSSDSPITRIATTTNLQRTEKITKSTSLSWNGRYDQGLYSDDTAQYALQYGGTLNQTFAPGSTLTVNYNNLKQVGYTPLAIDRRGRNDQFAVSLNWNFKRGWGATAQTGYDVLSFQRGQSPWQLVSLGTTYRAKDSRFSLLGSYDTYNTSWGTFRADGQWKMFGSDFAAALRYDGLRSTWAGGSLEFRALKLGKITLDTLVSYNGYTKRLDAQQYTLAYDLHCVDAVLAISDYQSGFRGGRQIAFFIRIKALPFGSDFGYGRQGQRIGGAGGFGGG